MISDGSNAFGDDDALKRSVVSECRASDGERSVRNGELFRGLVRRNQMLSEIDAVLRLQDLFGESISSDEEHAVGDADGGEFGAVGKCFCTDKECAFFDGVAPGKSAVGV